MQWMVMMTLACAAGAGCYAPVAKTTPAVGQGVRVSVSEGACQAARPHIQELASEETGEVSFANSLRIDGQALVVTPLRVLPLL